MSMLARNLLIYIVFLFTLSAQAFLESPSVLPAGRNSLSVIGGKVDSLNHYFSNQKLVNFSDQKSIDFDIDTLRSINSEVDDLYNALNQFGNYQLGETVHMGTLKFDLAPDVDYQSLVYARGINKKWTVGLGLTFVRFSLKVGMQHQGSNIPKLIEELGGASEQLDEGFKQLNQNALVAVQQELSDRNYSKLESKTSHFVGDSQLVSMYNIKKTHELSVSYKAGLTLPTGPVDNPNSITELGGFHQTSLEQKIIAEAKPLANYSIVGALGFKHSFDQTLDKRIPIDAADTLPKYDQLRSLTLSPGEQISLHLSGVKKFNDNFSFGVGYNYIDKAKDSYSRVEGLDSSILENNTNSRSQSIDLELSYNTISDYFNKKALIPFNVWFSVSDVFSGVNTQRKTDYAVWAMLFF